MQLRTELPHLVATCRDGSYWVLPIESTEDFRRDWMAGKPFWAGSNVWGSVVYIKLADITGLSVKTADVIHLQQEEDEEVERRKLLSLS